MSHSPSRLELRVTAPSAPASTGRCSGPISGSAAPRRSDMSRHWLRARRRARGRRRSRPLPGVTFEHARGAMARARAAASRGPSADGADRDAARVGGRRAQPRRSMDLPATRTLADLTRDDRRRLVHAIAGVALPVPDSRGYSYAEVDRRRRRPDEIDPGTMESDGAGTVSGRRDPGRGRTSGRLQLPVGLVDGARGGTALAREPVSAGGPLARPGG